MIFENLVLTNSQRYDKMFHKNRTKEMFHRDMKEEQKVIKKLNVPQEFNRELFTHKLVKFESGIRDVAIYEITKTRDGTKRGWEVVVVKYTTKETEFYGNIRPIGSPILPSAEQFGHSGWHFNKWESVEKKFNELLTSPLKKGGRKSSVIFI